MAKSIHRDASWLRRTDVDQMLYELAPHRGERRLVLFACACCRLAWPLLHADARRTVEVFELFADGRVGRRECSTRPAPIRGDTRPAALWAAEAVAALRGWWLAGPYEPRPEAGLSAAAAGVRDLSGRLQAAGLVADHAARAARDAVREWAWTRARHLEAALAADVYGTALHPPWTVRPEWLSWGDGCLAKMARVLYDDHRFDDMPILADALEEAGCDDDDVLSHCRLFPRHARGCWVVDALLAPP